VLDLGLSKLAIIGVVALVVVGPERLPKVARTVGTLLGRAQRYLADVKAEVNREMQIDELRAMRDTVHQAASSFESSVRGGLSQTEADLNAAFAQPTDSSSSPLMTSIAPPTEAITPAKRRNFRRNLAQRQSAMPMWFKSANRKRTRVQSGAARVKRYRVR
jgi:sec-independent protein translocase protein TatB